MSILGGEDTIYWLRTWHHIDQEKKIMLHDDKETLIGYMLNQHSAIGKGGRDEEI